MNAESSAPSDQPIGFPVQNWTTRPRPPRTPMTGRFCRVEPVDVAAHAQDLYAAHAGDRDGRNWTYFNYGPFGTFSAYRAWLA